MHPLAEGGVHDVFNIAPACAVCNGAKGNLPLTVFVDFTAGHVATGRDVAATE